jgi:hypothetical protein
MFDDHGAQSYARKLRLANTNDDGDFITSLLVSSVPTPGRLTFEDVSPQSTRITLLEVECSYGPASGYSQFEPLKVQFRNICLTASCDPNLTPPSQAPPSRKNQKK